jgi:cell division protein FtsI/penicillin-binding protein 2
MTKHSGNSRITIFLAFVLIASGLILYRLFILSVVRHPAYLRTSQAQNENISNVLARGNIYFSDKDSNTFLAATNKKFQLAYVVPGDIKAEDKEKAAGELSGILGIEKGSVMEKINSGGKSLKVVARRISNEQMESVKGLKIKGVGVSYEMDRFYPADSLAANAVGFFGYDANGERAGQYGIEEYYNQDLFGREPNLTGIFSAPDPVGLIMRLAGMITGKKQEAEAKFDRPADVVLTIDKNIQNFVEEKLKEILGKWQAEKGSIIVQEPKTGKILAMAHWPSFDPNSYSGSKPENFLNGNIQEVYEPGSSFKPVIMAAGIDLSKITPQTSYEDKGFIDISGYTIHNFSDKVFGIQTMSDVLEKSINTGTMFVENLVGDDNFLNYIVNMGFGQKTGVDLPGEVSGDITNLYSGRKINFLTASFGQGIAVTPLQLINAYSAIANGGKLMRPYIVDRIIKDGEEDEVTKPEIVSIPISSKTAVKLQSMLISVVDNGFDRAKIPGYDVAGKTGTAQIPDGSGGYSENIFIHNFLGFAPAYDAKFVILIKMDKPQGITFAADSLSPTFKEITTFLINYYGIPPTRK